MYNRRSFCRDTLGIAGIASVPIASAEAQAGTPQKTPDDAFLAAVGRGDVPAVSRMLDNSPQLLYARDAKGQSAYLLAAYSRRDTIMHELEKRGLRLDIYEAAAGARIDTVKSLLHGAPSLLVAQNAVGDTPLHTAARAGAFATLDNAIGYGPNFAIANDNGETVAHLAVACPEREAAEAMTFATIGNAADPNAKRKDGSTVLDLATRSGNERVIRLVLQKSAAGSDSLPRDFYGRRYRYNAKFEPLVRDDTNGLPREFVNAFVLYSHFALPRIKQWVNQCPDLLNTRAAWDELSVEAAAHMGRKDIGSLLLDKGAAYSLPTAVVFGSTGDVKRMLGEEPKCIHERGAHSFPLLFYTAFGEPKLDAAELLIASGADVREDMRGRTVLHVAAGAGHTEMCRFFIEKGLNPSAVGDSFLGKQTAAKAASDAGHADLAKMLADWGQSQF